MDRGLVASTIEEAIGSCKRRERDSSGTSPSKCLPLYRV